MIIKNAMKNKYYKKSLHGFQMVSLKHKNELIFNPIFQKLLEVLSSFPKQSTLLYYYS